MNVVPEISVVMSVFNGSECLKDSIESVLSQKEVNFEFLIVNDGSTDNTDEILNYFYNRDKRIRIITQYNNGLTKALIKGCEEAKGKYIARQDVGDFSHPNRLKKLLELMRSDENIVMSSCWAAMIGPKNELLCKITRPSDPKIATNLILHQNTGPPHHGSVMFRKSAYLKVGGYRKEFYYAQDSDLWLRLCEVGLISYYPEYLYAFKYDFNSISVSKRPIQKKYGFISHECRRARLRGEDEEIYLKKAATINPKLYMTEKKDFARGYYFIAGCLRSQSVRNAVEYYKMSLKYRPFSIFSIVWLIYIYIVGKNYEPIVFDLEALNQLEQLKINERG